MHETEYEPGHCPDSKDGQCFADSPCVYGCDEEGHLNYADMKAALRDSLLRTHWVLCHPSVVGMSTMAVIHGATYSGPVWSQQPEIQKALKAAGLPEELPLPEYPSDEFGIFPKKFATREVNSHTYTEHIWEQYPNIEEALHTGTRKECFDYWKEHALDDNVFYTTLTGRVLDRGEEEAFFAQFR